MQMAKQLTWDHSNDGQIYDNLAYEDQRGNDECIAGIVYALRIQGQVLVMCTFR
jgi:hypothetical protein